MPRVLILDDEPVAAEVLAEASRRLGLTPVVTHRAEEALDRLGRGSFDLVLLDLLLPGIDGLEAARRIRRDRSPHLPIIAVSGVVKPASVARDLEAVRARFLRKPLDLALFESTVRAALGRPAVSRAPAVGAAGAAGATGGGRSGAGGGGRAGTGAGAAGAGSGTGLGGFTADPERVPVYRLYRRLWESRATGTLVLGQERVRRRIAFHQGWIRAATSNVVGETAGGLLVARGTLERAQFDAAVEAARAQGVAVTEALVQQGVLDRPAAQKALGAQVREVAVAAVGVVRGQARFAPEAPAGGGPGPHRVHPLQAAVDGVRRFWTTEALSGWLGARADRRPKPSEAMRRDAYVLRATTPGEAIWGRIDGRRTLGDLLASARPEDLPLLFVVVATGLAALEEGAAPEGRPAQAGRPAASTGGGAAAAEATRAPTAEASAGADGETAERIRNEHTRLGASDHYQALGVDRKADAQAVQAAYLEKARTWHTDRFAGVELGDARGLLEGIFQRIGEARRVLTDAEARKEYDIWLDRTERGLPTDVGAILRAEEIFRVGERLLKGGKAAEALERFDEALSLNHAEPEFKAYRAYAGWLEGDTTAEAARKALTAALKEQPRMAAAHYFLGRIAAAEEDPAAAAAHYRSALEVSPDHPEAKAQLARLNRERTGREGAKGGLLKRFLKR